MEKWERDHIQQHLQALAHATEVSSSLLQLLRAKGVLTGDEVEEMEFRVHQKYDKAFHLYDILLTKADGFKALANALLSTKQTEACRILMQGRQIFNQSRIRPNQLATTTVFSSNLPEIEELLHDDKVNVLIVSTPDVQLSLKRIADVGKQYLILHDGDTASFSKRILQSIEKGAALVVPCDKVKKLLKKLKGSTTNVVFLTRESSTEVHRGIGRLKENTKIVNEEIHWSHLTPDTQKTILQQKVIFQNQVIRLEELPAEILTTEELGGQVVFDLLRGTTHQAWVNFSVPDPPSPTCYVPRKIARRTNISPEVFQSVGNDVFVVDGIKLYQLTKLTRKSKGQMVPPVARSSQQLKALTAQFIQLEYASDYESICKLTENPVHLISHHNGEYIWRKSHSSLGCIQKYILDSQTIVDKEDNFLERCLKSENPICIAKSPRYWEWDEPPGMGKTTLLTRIAEKVLSESPLRYCVVRFLTPRDLVPDELQPQHEIDIDFACELVAKSSSDYEFGRKLVIKALKSEKIKCHVFLDGYDELTSNQMKTVNQILECLRQLKNTQLYVTTRPHRCHELEEALVTLAYHIEPFDEEDQVAFLTGYWNDAGATKNSQLEEFAKSCLHRLKTNMAETGGDIIPDIQFQCRLVAEVYSKEAKKEEGGKLLLNESSAYTLFEMFQMFMGRSFRKVEATEKNRVIRAQMYYATKQLFPEIEPQIKLAFLETNWNPEDSILLLPGIFEKAEHDDHPRFKHLTLAEYRVAHFVSECLKETTDKSMNKIFAGMILRKVLSTKGKEDTVLKLTYPKSKILSQIFKYPLMCYFLNSFMLQNSVVGRALLETSHSSIIPIPAFEMLNIFIAAVTSNFPAIPSFLANLSEFKTDNFPWSNLFLLAAKYAGTELMRKLAALAKQQQVQICETNYPLKKALCGNLFGVSPLHVAVHWGNYNVTMLLLNEYGFHDLLAHQSKKLKYLLHVCVMNSCEDAEPVVNGKIQIIKCLCVKGETTGGPNPYRHILEERNPDETTPLLEAKVHPKLIQTLIQVGADTNATNKRKQCVLHTVTDGFSPAQYHELVESLTQQTTFKHYDLKTSNYGTPLRWALENLDIELTTVDLFLRRGADIHYAEYGNGSILFSVLRRGRSKEFVRELALRGANVRCNINQRTTIIPAKAMEAVEYIVDTSPSLLNASHPETPENIIIAGVHLEDMDHHQLSSYVLSLFPPPYNPSVPSHAAEPCFVVHNLQSNVIKSRRRKDEDSWGLALNYNKIEQSNGLVDLRKCTAKIVLVKQDLVDQIEKVFEETGKYPIVAVEENQLMDLNVRSLQLIFDTKFSVHGGPKNFQKVRNKIFLETLQIRGKLVFDLTIEHRITLIKRELCDDTTGGLLMRHTQENIEVNVLDRRNISKRIFSAPVDDVFVIEGMSLLLLSSLAQGKLADKSSNQTSVLTARYIQLESENEFSKICNLSNFPVHLLSYQNGNLRWVKSHGSLTGIQQHLEEQQQEISLSTILDEFTRKDTPICLAYKQNNYNDYAIHVVVAALMYQIYQNPSSVVFSVKLDREFFESMTLPVAPTSLVKYIAEMLSDYTPGREYITNCLESEEIACHLIFCCEHGSRLFNNFATFTNAIISSMKPLKNTQLYVFVESGNLMRMEETLQTLGFSIENGEMAKPSTDSSGSEIVRQSHVSRSMSSPFETGKSIPGNGDDINMHKSQMEWIRLNLCNLVQQTECTDTLIEKLKVKGVITDTDALQLMSMEKSKLWRRLHLYKLVEKRMDVFHTFLEIILSERQTSAYQILQRCVNNLCKNSDKPLFLSPIPEVAEFLSDESRICIISTPDLQVSFKRIRDTILESVVVEDVNAEKVEEQLPHLGDQAVLVVSCKKLGSVLHQVRKATKKVIIVTEMNSDNIHIILASIELDLIPVVVTEKISWVDINPTAYEAILSQPIIFQSNVMSLQDFFVPINLSQIPEKLLVDLLTGKCPELVRNTVSALPEFPLRRQLSVARKISRDVVKCTVSDVFVIKGATLEELSTLAHEKVPGMSSTQTEKVTLQVILLESEEHFEKICELVDHPVHLLSYGPEHMTWISSYGSQNMILQHLLDQQHEEMSEDQFIEKCISSEYPVCIAGESGMGKSVMLAKVGQTIMNTDPNCVVCYVVLKSLVPHLEHETLEGIAELITEQSSDYELGREIVKTALTTPSIKCHVLFDGHGETSRNRKTNSVAGHLAKICRQNKNRFTMTSRKTIKGLPVGTPAFEINPIPQTDILIHYWTSRRVLDNSLLHEFANTCLRNLYDNMTEFEYGISENISLCQLLAEVHLKEAKDFSTRRQVKGEQVSPSTITSIFELHQRFTDSCFEDLHEVLNEQNFDEATIDGIQNAHMFYAIDLLYQKEDDGLESFKNEFYRPPSPFIPVIEMIRKDKTFVYKSVAEYLVGFLVVKLFKNSQFKLTKSLANFLFGSLLATSIDNSESILDAPSLLKKCQSINACDFQNSAVCYFFNLLLKSQKFDEPQFDSIFKETRSISFHKILVASVYRNFHLVGQFIIRFLSNVRWRPDWPNLLLLTAKHFDENGELKFLADLTNLLNSQCPMPPPELEYPTSSSPSGFKVTPLHVAIERGNVHIMKFLLNNMGFQSYLQDTHEQGHYLLQMCLYDSEKNLQKMIDNKIKILDILCMGSALKSLAIKMASKGNLGEFSVHPNLVDALSSITGCNICSISRPILQSVETNTTESQTKIQRRAKRRPLPYPPPQTPGCSKGVSIPQHDESLSLEELPVRPEVVIPTRGEDEVKCLVVNSKHCSLDTVLDTFGDQLKQGNLCDKLLEIALRLNLPYDTIKQISELRDGGESYLGCDKMLRTWTNARGKEATLGVLMEALTKSDQTKLCENLMDRFQNVGSL